MTMTFKEYKERMEMLNCEAYELCIQRAKDLLEEGGKVHYAIDALERAQK